jgi:hypothetical protein
MRSERHNRKNLSIAAHCLYSNAAAQEGQGMQVTLYVWKLQTKDVGHVSLEIGSTYMSYWPANGVDSKKQVKLGSTQDAAFQRAYVSDRRLEQRNADARVDLTGLEANAMLEAWNQFRASPTRYNLVRHNCATIIASLLEIGSGIVPPFCPHLKIDDFAGDLGTRMLLWIRFMSTSIDMWTPNSVLLYAQEIQRTRSVGG